MWISSVTFDLVTIRTLMEEDVVAVYYSIQNRKEEKSKARFKTARLPQKK